MSLPKLDLTQEERNSLRKGKIRLSDLASQTAAELSRTTGIAVRRCRELVSLAQFQTLGSVGLESARDLLALGFVDLEGLKQGDPVEMYDRLKSRSGGQLDPCVEDVFRCAIAQAQDPHLSSEFLKWWLWSPCRGESSIRVPVAVVDRRRAIPSDVVLSRVHC
jgi:hypothetical protein